MLYSTGADLLRELRKLPPEELDRPASDLVDQYDQPRCDDCRRHHWTPWEALACDQYVDARRRRDARRLGRQVALAERQLAGPGVALPPRFDDEELTA